MICRAILAGAMALAGGTRIFSQCTGANTAGPQGAQAWSQSLTGLDWTSNGASPLLTLGGNEVYTLQFYTSSGQVSRRLIASNFGFNLPANATIQNIRVRLRVWGYEYSNSAGCLSRAIEVQLYAPGTGSSANVSGTAVLPSSYSYLTYCGSPAWWGLNGIGPSDVNSPSFAVWFRADCQGCYIYVIGNMVVYCMQRVFVDYVDVTIYYDVPFSLDAVELDAWVEGDSIWISYALENPHRQWSGLVLERSYDGNHWIPFARIPLSEGIQTGRISDPYSVSHFWAQGVSTVYYRARFTGWDGSLTEEFSSVVAVSLSGTSSISGNSVIAWRTTPEILRIRGLAPGVYQGILRDISGRSLAFLSWEVIPGVQEISLGLPPDIRLPTDGHRYPVYLEIWPEAQNGEIPRVTPVW